MKSSIIYLGRNKTLLKKIEHILTDTKYDIFSAESYKKAEKIIEDENITIVLVTANNTAHRKIRDHFFYRPIQVIYLSRAEEDISPLLNTGYDDFIKYPFDNMELQFRIKAALIRYNQQYNIIEERNFFRQAVKNEEALAEKILDKHLHLKQAFMNIEHLNEELSQSNERLERIARYDLLSGLLNRMSLFSMLEIEIERAIRTGVSLCGMMLDIDDFKKVNDNYGHLLGDKVIKLFGDLLKKCLRKYDHPGRYGGEEFFVVLPNTDSAQAFSIAERFRKTLAETVIDTIDGTDILVTTSIGIGQFKNNEGRENWIARTDKALYEAKHSGKNCTIKYSDIE